MKFKFLVKIEAIHVTLVHFKSVCTEVSERPNCNFLFRGGNCKTVHLWVQSVMLLDFFLFKHKHTHTPKKVQHSLEWPTESLCLMVTYPLPACLSLPNKTKWITPFFVNEHLNETTLSEGKSWCPDSGKQLNLTSLYDDAINCWYEKGDPWWSKSIYRNFFRDIKVYFCMTQLSSQLHWIHFSYHYRHSQIAFKTTPNRTYGGSPPSNFEKFPEF